MLKNMEKFHEEYRKKMKLSSGESKIAAGLRKMKLEEETKEAAEAINTMGDFVKETEELNKITAQVIRKQLERAAGAAGPFMVNGPATFSVFVDGGWRQDPFIGEEQLLLVNVIKSLSGPVKLIFIDEINYPFYKGGKYSDLRKVRQIEMEYSVALSHLDRRFAKFIDRAWDNHDDRLIAEARKSAKKIENEAQKEPSPYDDPVFGSW